MPTPPPEPLLLPDSIRDILRKHDSRTEDFDEGEVSFELERIVGELGELNDGHRKACFAEIAALQMPLTDGRERSRWGTRFGPVVDGTRRDGSDYCFPDIKTFDAQVIQHWAMRAAEVQHPVFKARYADVAWDLTKAATGTKPLIEMARQAIDAYIDCATRFPKNDSSEERLERALELALSVGDNGRADVAVAAMFRLLDHSEYPGARLIWLFEIAFRMKGVSISADQEKRLIDGLEAELQRICSRENPIGIVASEPALRLAWYYQSRGQQDDVKRVVRAYGEAVAKLAEKAAGFVAMHWYQQVYGVFLQFGLKEDAEKAQVAGKLKAEEANGQMAKHSISMEIPNAEMEEFLEQMTAGDLEATVERIAFHFCPSLNDLRRQLAELQKEFTLYSHIPVVALGENQVTARVGSIESDPEGRMMVLMADNLKFAAIFLGKTIDRAREKFEFTSKTLLPLLLQSPLFDVERTFLLEQGIEAYLAQDHVKTIHVLVPQIEHALRRLLAIQGKPTNKHRRSDASVMVEKSLNDILESEPVVQQFLSDDVTFYFRVFLCDSRGINLRNVVSHGLMAPKNFNRVLSDRLLHILFLLGIFGQKPTEVSSPT
ncbi:hypothetical protein LBMAG52_41630 [Planctomycetia bacterium]|nr:hypothetical protein LBMAG52_41630 [Planctomycetia bacterium]